jgi:hypothetical protein
MPNANERMQMLSELLRDDPSVKRAMMLPMLQRTTTDPIDDISEESQYEFAAPDLFRMPLRSMGIAGRMASGATPFMQNRVTDAAVDSMGLGYGVTGLFGGVPKGVFSSGIKSSQFLNNVPRGGLSKAQIAALRAESRQNLLNSSEKNINLNSKLDQSAKDYFGITRSPDETGYIMQDGTRLDLSGRHYAGGYKKQNDKFVPETGKPDYLAGDRAVDHRELYDLEGLKEGDHQWDAVEQLMTETGAVRYLPKIGISIIEGQSISQKQLKAIVKDFRETGNPLTIDIDPIGGNANAISKTFENPTVDDVKNYLQQNNKNININANASPAGLSRILMDEMYEANKPEPAGLYPVVDDRGNFMYNASTPEGFI